MTILEHDNIEWDVEPDTTRRGAADGRKSVTILGSTGTIGQNTLKIIDMHPDRFTVTALTGGENVALLAEQAKRYKPQRAVIANERLYGELKVELEGTGIEVAAGESAVLEAAAMPSSIVMSAIVGAAGLKPTLVAIRNGATIALANKECLVCAGELMTDEVSKHGATLLPVDSEHNGIFQLFDFSYPERIESVTITASGGPFREFTLEQMESVTPQQAVKHPNWNMGAKISVDSATLMNKGLELIEAFYLFPLRANQLHALVHPQSIVHCLIQMKGGSVLAQMSPPDMCAPIAYALAWPERIDAPVKTLDLAAIGNLQFARPDLTRFPALRVAREAMVAGGSAPIILNAANEVAVGRFLRGEIGFLDIVETVEKTLEKMAPVAISVIDDVFACDQQARRVAGNI
jgi:1-deoxy-D-xylulose-5-phosphate reductoisomerase